MEEVLLVWHHIYVSALMASPPRRLNVLIIDDDDDDTDCFCEAVSEVMPSAICTARSLCSNITLLINSLPEQQFIFLDAHLALFSSKQCFATLTTIVNVNHTRIIIYTGMVSPNEKADFLKCGAYEVLLKETVFVGLKASLERILCETWQ